MIEVRNGMFETNSSSCNVLVIPKEQEVRVPKTIDLSADDYDGDLMRRFIREELVDDESAKRFICFIYSKGVEEIKYHGRNKAVTKYIKECKGTQENIGLPQISPNFDCGDDWTEDTWMRFIFGSDNYPYQTMTDDWAWEELLEENDIWYIEGDG